MKYTKILVFALIAFFTLGEADAQVSVRRTSRSSTEQSAPKSKKSDKKSETKSKEKAADKATESTQKSSAASSEKAISKASNPIAAKRTTPVRKQQQQQPLPEGKSLRQQAFDDYQKDVVEETPWQHVVYRELDLTKEENASLYYPVEPQDGLTNLFRVIMEAFGKGELPAYEYLDGRELFTEKYRCKPQEILDKFGISYEVKNNKGVTAYELDESTVPSHQVLSYFVKERWEFDQKHSKYQTRILCICPVIHQSDEMSDDAKYPMFWLKYEDLRPFLRQHLVVSSGMNSAARYTMEEYFSLGQYKGDIYKDQNLRGLSLKQQVGENPDSLRMAQDSIDSRLKGFGDSIWMKDPLPEEKVTKGAKHKEKTAEKDSNKPSQPTGATKKNRRTKETVDLDAAAAEKEERATTHRSVRR